MTALRIRTGNGPLGRYALASVLLCGYWLLAACVPATAAPSKGDAASQLYPRVDELAVRVGAKPRVSADSGRDPTGLESKGTYEYEVLVDIESGVKDRLRGEIDDLMDRRGYDHNIDEEGETALDFMINFSKNGIGLNVSLYKDKGFAEIRGTTDYKD